MHWTLQGILWFSGAVLELAVGVVLLLRTAVRRRFPLFAVYVLLELLRTTLLFAIRQTHQPYARYFYGYWVTECIVCIFGLFVIAEVFRNAFTAKLGLQRIGTLIFRGSLLALIVFAVVSAASSPGNDSEKLIAGILVLKQAEAFVRIGLLFSLFAFVFLLGLPWSDDVIGIALGFALYGAVELAALAARSYYGASANHSYQLGIMGVNLCQKAVWLFYLASRSRALERVDSVLPEGELVAGARAKVAALSKSVEILLQR